MLIKDSVHHHDAESGVSFPISEKKHFIHVYLFLESFAFTGVECPVGLKWAYPYTVVPRYTLQVVMENC
jgi:hypothetical protein